MSCAFRIGVWPGPLAFRRWAGGPVSGVRGGPVPTEYAAGVAFDLKTFFAVTGKDPVEVTAADVFDFLADPRGDRSVIRLADRESGLSARRSPAACRRCRACMRTWSRGAIRRCGPTRCRAASRPGGRAGRCGRGPRRWCGWRGRCRGSCRRRRRTSWSARCIRTGTGRWCWRCCWPGCAGARCWGCGSRRADC